MKQRIVIALGGNALGKTNDEQQEKVKETAEKIIDLIEEGHEIIITHGNGPQVGMIKEGLSNENIPFPECGAMSQGYIGYHLQLAIQNQLNKKKIDKKCVTLITNVLVDKNDAAFKSPTKPIGKFYTKEEAEKLSKEDGKIYKEDSGRGYREIVASPKPKEILEITEIEQLVGSGNIVIACGGGGVPLIEENGFLKGIPAVIDKDLTSELLAEKINADLLLILTAVEKVCINFNTPNQQQLDNLSTNEAQKYIEEEQFAKGSMLPKVQACLKFAKNTNKNAIITSLDKAAKILDGKTGTIINSSEEE